jgi:hypothetical protein
MLGFRASAGSMGERRDAQPDAKAGAAVGHERLWTAFAHRRSSVQSSSPPGIAARARSVGDAGEAGEAVLAVLLNIVTRSSCSSAVSSPPSATCSSIRAAIERRSVAPASASAPARRGRGAEVLGAAALILAQSLSGLAARVKL